MQKTPLDSYKHLDKDTPVTVKVPGLEVEISIDRLVHGLLNSNRGVHRLLSALYHVANGYAQAYYDFGRYTYANEYALMAEKLKEALEIWKGHP
jgi:hypothetical protein